MARGSPLAGPRARPSGDGDRAWRTARRRHRQARRDRRGRRPGRPRARQPGVDHGPDGRAVPSEEIAWRPPLRRSARDRAPAGAGGRRPAVGRAGAHRTTRSRAGPRSWTDPAHRDRPPRARGHPTRLAGLREPGAGTAGRACRNRRRDAAGSSGAGTASGGIALAILRRPPKGNPLFVEQFVAYATDEALAGRPTLDERTAVDLSIPPTIGALLAARLDRLPEAERHVLERASSLGGFWTGALTELLPETERRDVAGRLARLARRDLIRPQLSTSPIRTPIGSVTCSSATRPTRACPSDRSQLHERFADWLERSNRQRESEVEEILGYHLEQAYRYRDELGRRRGGGPRRSSVDAAGRPAGVRSLVATFRRRPSYSTARRGSSTYRA